MGFKTVAAASALALGAALPGVGVASANTAMASRSGSRPQAPTARSVEARDVGPRQVVVNCYRRIDYPHASSHVGGTVNVVAHSWCDADIVAVQFLSVSLYRNGRLVAHNVGVTGNASLNTNAATHCVSGAYYGKATDTKYFVPGWSPPVVSGTVTSRTINISC